MSYRSAYAGGITPEGAIHLSRPTGFNRKITVPGGAAAFCEKRQPDYD